MWTHAFNCTGAKWSQRSAIHAVLLSFCSSMRHNIYRWCDAAKLLYATTSEKQERLSEEWNASEKHTTDVPYGANVGRTLVSGKFAHHYAIVWHIHVRAFGTVPHYTCDSHILHCIPSSLSRRRRLRRHAILCVQYLYTFGDQHIILCSTDTEIVLWFKVCTDYGLLVRLCANFLLNNIFLSNAV